MSQTDPIDVAVELWLGCLIAHGLGLEARELAELPTPDWEALRALLAIHRLGGLVGPVLSSQAVLFPAPMLRWSALTRDLTTRMNGANLLAMRRVLPRLQSAGIPALAFKGPVLQQMAYGSFFHRPASDLDILVHYSDFSEAGRVLGELDYVLAPVCRSIWWKIGLGEQHFNAATGPAVTLDLHHRVQQPGCPLPQQPERLFEHSVKLRLGDQDLPTLSPVHAGLLAAMSYVKALHHREPAARYLVDLIALTKDHALVQLTDLKREARQQGLETTLALAVRAARVLVGHDILPAAVDHPVLPDVTDATLRRMTLTPSDPTIAWPRRRAVLFALYDRKAHYPVGFAAMVGSDLLRRIAIPRDMAVRNAEVAR